MSPRNIGIIEIILSGIAYGFLGVFGKAAYTYGISSGELLSLRFLFAAFILFFVLLAKKSFQKISKEETIKSLLLGIFGYAVFSSCYFRALQGLSASLTVLLLYLYPVIVSLGALFLFKEKISKNAWIALPVSVAGMMLLVWGDMNVQDNTSLLFGFASAFFYAAYILASRKWLQNAAPLPSVFYIQLGTALTLGILNFQSFERHAHMISVAWPIFIGISVISTILPMLLFLNGLKKLSSAEVSILSTTEPVVAILAASFVLGERLSNIQTLGAALVIAALILTSAKRTSKKETVRIHA